MNYTSIEQSKKLLELGLSTESADMFWQQMLNINDDTYSWKVRLGQHKATEHQIPCWSVGALFNILPESIFIENVGSCDLIIFKVKSGYYIHYDYDIQSEEAYFISETGKTLIEAAYNMVVCLLENNYLKTESPLTPSVNK